MTLESGDRVRTLVELVADDSVVLRPGTLGYVVGYQGDRLVVAIHDMDNDTDRSLTCERWEVIRS